MHTFIKRALWGALIAGGMTLIGATTASAVETGGDDGILAGTQLEVPISIPITVADNAISLLGSSSVETPASTSAPEPGVAPQTATDGSDGVGSGTQAVVGVTLPVTVSGNSIAVLGTADSDGAPAGSAPVGVAPEAATGGDGGVLSGTQGIISVDVPVTVSGNAIAVLGDSDVTGGTAAASAAPGAPGDTAAGGAVTDGSDSLLGGTQVIAPIAAPVVVGGNAISLLGESTVTGGAAPSSAPGTDLLSPLTPLGPVTSGVASLLGGSQLALPVSLPVTIEGNAIGILVQSTVTGSSPVTTTDPGGPNPGTGPGSPTPGANPGGQGGQGGTLPPAAGRGALAVTGSTGTLPLALMALALLGAGGVLLRRRAA